MKQDGWVMKQAQYVLLLGIFVLNGCRTSSSAESENKGIIKDNLKKIDACTRASNELTDEEKKEITATYTCTRYLTVKDKSTSDFYTKTVSKTLNACVVLVGNDKAVFSDTSHDILYPLVLQDNREEDVLTFYRGRDAVASTDVFAVQNPFHFYHFKVMKNGKSTVAVDRQWIGIRQRNLFIYEAECTKK